MEEASCEDDLEEDRRHMARHVLPVMDSSIATVNARSTTGWVRCYERCNPYNSLRVSDSFLSRMLFHDPHYSIRYLR